MQISEELPKLIDTCEQIARNSRIVSIGMYGSQVCGYARKDSDFDILLVLNKYPDGARYIYKTMDGKQFAILAVDQRALELDAKRGDLGDFVAGRLLSPYISLLNPDYLGQIEFTTKRRFALEDLEDLVIEYGELARGLVIKLEYLVLTRMEKRARAYPPLKYSYANMLKQNLKDINMKSMLNIYGKVLENLESSGTIKISGETISISDGYVEKILSHRIRNKVVNLMDFSKRTLYSYLTHGKAGKVRLNVVARELASKIKREIQITFNGQEIEDPKDYLFLKTEQGLINLNKKDAIIEKIRNLRGNKQIEVKNLMGVLNEVSLANLKDEKLVIKKFKNWYNLRWFILNIGAYGTKIFQLDGNKRLSNEYVTNQLLAENKIPVPEIISISLQDRMLVERYIKGRPFSETVRNIVKSNRLTATQRQQVFGIGRLLAKIHQLNVTMGDCKPENFIAGEDGKIYVIDLEQGQRSGDKSWDVAVFLYFSGHYETALTPTLQHFVKAFISGYSSIGQIEVLRNAARLRYKRAFLAWTNLRIIQGIASILKNASS